MSSFTRRQLEDWLKTISVDGGRILDIGGSQLPIKDRLKSFKADEYKILDLENPHQGEKPDIVCDLNEYFHYFMKSEKFLSRKIDVDTVPMQKNLEDIKNKKWNDYFNTAFCLEVSEYWYNPYQALKNINYFLKQGGELYISFHFQYPVHNPIENDYLRYTPEGALKILKESGFKIDDFTPRFSTYSNLVRRFWEKEKMRPSKEYDNHDFVGCLIKAIKL